MTRDDIYDHLAQVYLGKRKKVDEKKKWQLNAWLVINVVITLIIFSSAVYGLTAFLNQKRPYLESSIIYSLHNGLAQINYNFNEDYAPVKSLSLVVPELDVGKYKYLKFSIRGKEEGIPGIVKVVIENTKHESSTFYVKNINLSWKDISIPLQEFNQISDWTTIKNVTFVLESWNVDKVKGIVLIDNIRFSSS